MDNHGPVIKFILCFKKFGNRHRYIIISLPIYIVACQAHLALVKIGLVLIRLFHLSSFFVCIHLVKVFRTPCVCQECLFRIAC